MKTAKVDSRGQAPVTRLRSFIAKFEPRHQTLIRAVRRAIRAHLPTADELVYDNYNFFVIGFGSTDRPSDCIVSIVAGASGVSLCFIHGASLPDPQKALLGSGKQTRFIRVDSARAMERQPVKALLAAAVARSRMPFRASGRGNLIIRSVSAKQRPRRRSAK